jgi:hypothetical protein
MLAAYVGIGLHEIFGLPDGEGRAAHERAETTIYLSPVVPSTSDSAL